MTELESIVKCLCELQDEVRLIDSKLVGQKSISELRRECQYWDDMEQKSGGAAKRRWKIRIESYEQSGFSTGGTRGLFEIDGIEGINLISSRQISCILGGIAEALSAEKCQRAEKIELLIPDLKRALEEK